MLIKTIKDMEVVIKDAEKVKSGLLEVKNMVKDADEIVWILNVMWMNDK